MGAPVLPIRAHAERILEAVRANPVTVVIGETGSGKTTQISQVEHRGDGVLALVSAPESQRLQMDYCC